MGTGPYESRIIFDPLHTYTEVNQNCEKKLS